MVKKQSMIIVLVLAVILILAACSALTEKAPSSTPMPVLTATLGLPTQAPAPAATQKPGDTPAPAIPSQVPTSAATITASPTEPAVETYVAYVQNDALLVTHVMSGKALETHEYIKSPQSGGIMRIGWSPSGEYLAFTMIPDSNPHVYVVNVKEDGKPIDLGIADLGNGNDWAWSPDSKLLAFEHEYELWDYSPANGTKKQLTTHLGVEWLWSLPVFTPDGKALWAVGTDSNNMDFHGTTLYKIYQVPLDGSAANLYPPGHLVGITGEIKGTLPFDLRFSPDGQNLAMITTEYIENCAQKAFYQVGKADGKDIRDFPIPSLAAMVGPNQDPYFYGDSMVWDPQSKGLWVNGAIQKCTFAATVVGGPQISYIALDGQEHEQIPGAFSHLSMDRTGTLLGVVNAKDGPRVQILGRDGHLVLDLGNGDLTALQP